MAVVLALESWKMGNGPVSCDSACVREHRWSSEEEKGMKSFDSSQQRPAALLLGDGVGWG